MSGRSSPGNPRAPRAQEPLAQQLAQQRCCSAGSLETGSGPNVGPTRSHHEVLAVRASGPPHGLPRAPGPLPLAIGFSSGECVWCLIAVSLTHRHFRHQDRWWSCTGYTIATNNSVSARRPRLRPRPRAERTSFFLAGREDTF